MFDAAVLWSHGIGQGAHEGLDLQVLLQRLEQLGGILPVERFAQLVAHGLASAGCQHTLPADSGLEILRQASKALPRQASRIPCTTVQRGMNHLPDELLQQAIAELQ